MARASECTPVPSRDPHPTNPAKSTEGIGKDLLADNYDGRLTMEVVGSMHEVSRCTDQADLSARPRWRS